MRDREEKRKLRKGKIALVAGIIAVVILAVIIIVNVVNKKNEELKEKEAEANKNKEVVYELPNITYSDMQVNNIQMEYLKENNETMVSMTINNTTEVPVNQESLTAYLIDTNEEIIGQTKTYIESLNPGEQYNISVILKGDLTATKQIKLQK